MNTQLTARLDYLDALRAFALLLGIAFHAALSFMPIFIGWAVMDVSTSNVIPSFVLVSHSFRMALFFLIAGYFSNMTLHKNGLKAFIQSRLLRVGIPLVIGWFMLRPLLVSGWIIGAESMRGDADIMNGLMAGLSSLSELPQGLLIGTHLWFLYYLLLISIIVIALRSLLHFFAPVKKRITLLTERVMKLMSQSTYSMLILVPLTAIALWFMQHWGLDTPDKSLMPHLPLLCIYGGFFMFGWMLNKKKSILTSFALVSKVKVMACIFSIIVSIYLSGFQGDFAHPHYMLVKASFMLSYALMMWSLISLSIGLSKRWLYRPNRLVRYIADASYWLYLVHLPIVIYLQISVAELDVHWAIKLACIFAITVGISLLLYDLIVRSTFIGATLNGTRKPRLLFVFNKRSKH